MHIGLLTDSVASLSLDDTLDLARDIGARSVEFAAGDWSTSPHIDVPGLLRSESDRAELLRRIAGRGLDLAALNASGNQLHPVHHIEYDGKVRDVIRLAGALGVTTVVLMSGLPAGAPGDTVPNWITTSWPPETTRVHDYQWNDVVLPYWADLAAFATAEGIERLAVEMHANQVVFSVPGVLRLREAIGPIVAANLDPSHLLWMGADPLAAADALAGVVAHVHAKDTRIEERAAVRSLLDPLTVPHVDERSWNFVTVGRGHDVRWWAAFVDRLRAGGYDGVLSIEHEDARVDGVDGVREAAGVLRDALDLSDADR
ncbi:sugar phosphate isomerase/epimerase [Microbacterium sp.]|uniref:sugar phosphate isomerase/epimerase family protein n=1 Tax=Microbacterium sp. TaxID=51671 RepID=UPI003221F871